MDLFVRSIGMNSRRGPEPWFRIMLTRSERKKLRRMCRRYSLPHREVVRAKMILLLDDTPVVADVARKLSVHESTVRRWRDRFLFEGRRKALTDAPRTGRPCEIDAASRCEIIAMACAKPSEMGVKFRDTWTCDSLYERFVEMHPDKQMSRTAVVRILTQEGLRPHKVKMWLHSPDPEFKEKVDDICNLYLNPPPESIVLCVDEKTGMQALGRKHPFRSTVPGRDARMDYEYIRNGTRKLIASFDPHTGEVYGEVREGRTADDLISFMEALAKLYPDQQVHIVWDNLNIHHDGPSERWTLFNKRHGGRFHFHYTPIHASWINQIELLFGVLQRRVLRHGVFDTLEQLDDAVIGFLEHWNMYESHPFNWTFKGYRKNKKKKAA